MTTRSKSTEALIKRHKALDGEIEKMPTWQLMSSPAHQANKVERCEIKTELMRRAENDDNDARLYAITRKWMTENQPTAIAAE